MLSDAVVNFSKGNAQHCFYNFPFFKKKRQINDLKPNNTHPGWITVWVRI